MIEAWRLANGLRVVVQADPRWPLVATTMAYDAGSRWDPPARAGLAHLCEHLAFEGPRRGPGPTLPERIERAGGMTKGVTTPDQMAFSAVLPRSALGAALAVEADRMMRPVDPDEQAIEIERRVLSEELRERSHKRLRAAAFEQIHRRLFPPSHPYRRPPAGEAEGIRRITREDVERFASAHIVARHAVLVIVGDVSIRETAALVSRTFETVPGGADVTSDSGSFAERLQPSAPAVRVPAPVAETHAHLAWVVAGFGQPDWYRASLLMRGLAAGRSSALAQALVEREGIAREVHGALVPMRHASTLVLSAIGAPGVDGSAIERALIDATDRLLARGPSPAEAARAHKRALSDHYFLAQNLERRADLAAALTLYLDAPQRLDEEPQRYIGTTRDAIAAFASDLRHDAPAAVSLVPRAEAA